jgi:hypothetical protein
MNMSLVIILSIVSGILIPIFTTLFSIPRLRIKTGWARYISSSCAGFVIWLILMVIFGFPLNNPWDLLCGVLVILCAIWSNYWLGNFGGGFRVNMLVNLAEKTTPVPIEEWMRLYGGLGMEKFLSDRLQSILIPWKIVKLTEGVVSLTPDRGKFFGWAMNVLYGLLQGERRE